MGEWSMGHVVYDGDYLGGPKSAWRLELRAHEIIHDIGIFVGSDWKLDADEVGEEEREREHTLPMRPVP